MFIPEKPKQSPLCHGGARLIVLMIITALLMAIGGCGQVSYTVEEHLSRGMEFEQQGDLSAASIEYRNALQQDPSSAEGRYRLGLLFLRQGDGAGAETELKRARDNGKDEDEIRLPLLRALLHQQLYGRIMDETRQLESLPESQVPEVLAFRGLALLGIGNAREAENSFGEALALDPDLVDAQIGMAVIAFRSDRDPDGAREWLEKALENDPQSVLAWSLMGDLEQALGRFDEAEQAFGAALEHREYITLDQAKRALVRVQLGKLEEAEADIRALKRQGVGEQPYVSYVEGLLHFSRNELDAAATAFEVSHAAEPNFVPNRLYLATTKLLSGQTEQARQHAQWLYANVPNSQEVSRLLGAVRMSRREFAEARDILQTALQNSPEDRTTLGMLTTVSLLEGDAEKGAEYASRLAALEPESQPVRQMLMMARLMTGQELDGQSINGPTTDSDGDYASRFLRALEAFRDNRPDIALERARRLHEQYPDRVDPLNLMAASYLAMGQWDRAKVELEKVLDLEPGNVTAMRNLAKVEAQTGDIQRARTLLRSLVEEQPGDQEAALLLAAAEVRLGDHPAGIRVLEQVVEHNPDAHTARARLAGEHLRAGNVDRVLELTRRLNDTQVQAEPALLELHGKAQMRQGDVAAARASFEQWTRLAPDSAEAHFLYGDSLARSGEVALARQQLERTIELDPNYLPARVGRIKMLVQLGEVEQAREALSGLREDFGDRIEVLGIEGWFALGTGDFATAERSLSAVWEQRPDSELTILLVRALWGQAKHDEALSLMDDWLERQPRDVAVLMQLADAYLSLGREDDARETYLRVVEIQPEHVPALNNVAWLSRDENLEQAMEYAERAHQLAPRDPHVLDTLGMLKLQQGEIEQAYSLVREAADRSPTDAQIQLHLGRILVQMDRFEEARELLGRLVSQLPDTEIGNEARSLLDVAATQ